MSKDYYETLGVKKDSSEEEIKKAFRTMAKKYHPDANPGNKQSEERFKEINQAYEILGDKEKRKQYDTMKDASIHGFDFSDLWSGDKSQQTFRNRSFNDSSFDDLGSIFSSIFGNRNKPYSGREYRDEDYNYEITIPFEQAISGGKTNITVPVKTYCPTCSGTGATPGTQSKICPVCKGKGSISMSQGTFAFNQPCSKCFGRGTIITSPCRVCSGEGIITQNKEISIDIPSGINDGAVIQIANHSNLKNEGINGNIYLTVNVAPHHFFQRKGYDIHCEIPINIAQSILGSRIKVKTISGSIIINIKPGTQNDSVLRIPD
ncbi:MAG: DnaJ domain-containing protein, partial [Candidatus Firestonebacteria bacterium]|nr:DnaJ domain-containing protein [Candidatus Firestonebacteria bacterium]